jgi:MoxR-like ATPase
MNDASIAAAVAILKYNRSLLVGGNRADDGWKQPYLWPAFYGGSGAGKTARAEAVAREFGLPLHRLLLRTMGPEEVGGIPRASDDSDGLEWRLDLWARQPGLVLLDELDKAQSDHYSAVLSLLTDVELRGRSLRDSLFCAALQPVEEYWLDSETNRAVSARLVFLSVSQDSARSAVAKRHRRPSLDFLPADKPAAAPLLPVPSARQLDWLAGFSDSQWGADDDLLRLIVGGVVSADYAEQVFSWLRSASSGVSLKAETLLETLANDIELAKTTDIATLSWVVSHCAHVPGWTSELLETCLFRIASELEPSQARAVVVEATKTVEESPDYGRERGVKALFEPLSAREWNSIVLRVSDALIAAKKAGKK